ncbi:MAG: metallophosphoesterase [Lachnospiraceae bacterium]|nr:metallophosphoesterase [Lachnospiraceae bacterium]
MATYVISDIHGCYTAFQRLLKQIEFDYDNDELIIAGDIVDRGTENLEMLKYLENHPDNVTFLMGNHDYDFMESCRDLINAYESKENNCSSKKILKDEIIKERLLYDEYGTFKNLISRSELDIDDYRRWASLFADLEYYLIKEINGKKYVIVHAGYITREDYTRSVCMGAMTGFLRSKIENFYIWAREEAYNFGGMKNATIIFGHTPTVADSMFNNDGRVWTETNRRNRCRYINIDCGYVYKKYFPNANMAIIRLDDEKIFYLKEEV